MVDQDDGSWDAMMDDLDMELMREHHRDADLFDPGDDAVEGLPGGLRLFRVDVSGAVYWVLHESDDPAALQSILEKETGMSFEGEGWSPLVSENIRHITCEEALTLTCHEATDASSVTTMWDAAIEMAGSIQQATNRIVACSEW